MSESRGGESRSSYCMYQKNYSNCSESRDTGESRGYNYNSRTDIGDMRNQVMQELYTELYGDIKQEVRQELENEKPEIIKELKEELKATLKANLKSDILKNGGVCR